jgi:hypothetical protein
MPKQGYLLTLLKRAKKGDSPCLTLERFLYSPSWSKCDSIWATLVRWQGCKDRRM